MKRNESFRSIDGKYIRLLIGVISVQIDTEYSPILQFLVDKLNEIRIDGSKAEISEIDIETAIDFFRSTNYDDRHPYIDQLIFHLQTAPKVDSGVGGVSIHE